MINKLLLASLVVLLFTASIPLRDVDVFRHTEAHEDCATCHEEITPAWVDVAPDWYPEFGNLGGELVTIWNIDGDNCTLGNGSVVPCWWILPIPVLPPCNKAMSEDA